MGTYYVDCDVGLTGGDGSIGDPYGIETAIAAATPGDIFLWSPGGVGAVAPGHTLVFDTSGDTSAPIRWIGCDEGYNPTPATVPQVAVDAGGGEYDAVQVAGNYQIFENLRAGNTDAGHSGGDVGWYVWAKGVMLRNCWSDHCGTGLRLDGPKLRVLDCVAHDAGMGIVFGGVESAANGCAAYAIDGAGILTTTGTSLRGCRCWNCGGSGIELYRDAYAAKCQFEADHCSIHDCGDGIKIYAPAATQPNVFGITNCLLGNCSGYAVNVTTPAGQVGEIRNNGAYACTSGQVPAGRTGLINEGWIALTADPFVDAADGDLRLVRSTAAIGAALDGGDLGAIQRRFVRARHTLRGAQLIG